jgi:hypothetical protein
MINDDLLGQLANRYFFLHEGDPTITRKIALMELQERARLATVESLRVQLNTLYGTGNNTCRYPRATTNDTETSRAPGGRVRTIIVAFLLNATGLGFAFNNTTTQEM